MDNEILIAGMDKLENPFSRFVNEYGFHIVHLPYDAPARSVPDCKAAIICTNNISHSLRDRVIEEYKKRDAPFIMALGTGSSSIKDPFESLIVDSFKKKLEPLEIKDRILYLILYFNKIGKNFHSTSFIEVVKKYTKLSDAYFTMTLSELGKRGILQKQTGTGSQGLWKVLGLDKPERSRLINKIGESLPDKWLAEPVIPEPPKEVIVPVEEVKKMVEQVLPSELPTMEAFQKEIRDAVKQIADSVRQSNDQISTVRRTVERLTINTNSKEAIITDINGKISNLSQTKLMRVLEHIDLLLRTWNE